MFIFLLLINPQKPLINPSKKGKPAKVAGKRKWKTHAKKFAEEQEYSYNDRSRFLPSFSLTFGLLCSKHTQNSVLSVRKNGRVCVYGAGNWGNFVGKELGFGRNDK